MYPPVPYPPIEPIESVQEEPPAEPAPEVSSPSRCHKLTLTAHLQTPRPPKRTHELLSPFKAPRPASLATSPTPAAPKRTPVRPSTFQPLTSRSPRSTNISLAVELTNLERRVQTLRQARKYQRADEIGRASCRERVS